MIIGIDLGTTKSVVSFWKNGAPQIIPDGYGCSSIPSLVLVTPDEEMYVAREAQNNPLRYQGKNLTISSIKRLMGKRGETGWGWWKSYPQEVSGLILTELKYQAEKYLNQKIDKAVIAIPSHFDENQRWATKEAGEIAGLEVCRLLNEATAAVISYGFHRDSGKVLVFDFGGGTLDISILEFEKAPHEAKFYEVKSIEGDSKLGGDDFDQVIIDYIMENLRSDIGLDIELDHIKNLVLKEAAAAAKIRLSSELSTKIHIPGFLASGSRYYDLDVDLDRQTFESLSSDLFERANKVLTKALESANIKPSDLTALLLIGGSSRIPYLRQNMKKTLGIEPFIGVDSELCVAQGAAAAAAILEGNIENLLLLDVTPSSYGIGLKGGEVSKIIEKNTTIPTQHSQFFTTTEDNQTAISVMIYQGESNKASENTFLGILELRNLPPAKAGTLQIEVTFDVDGNNIVRVIAKDRATQKEEHLIIESPYRLNNAQIKVLKQAVQKWLSGRISREAERELEFEKYRTREQIISFKKKITQFLTTQQEYLDSKQISLLKGGNDLLEEYLRIDAPPQDLQKISSSIHFTYKEGIAIVIQKILKKLESSPEIKFLLSEVESNLYDPSFIGSSLQRLREKNEKEINLIIDLFRLEDPASQQFICNKIFDKIKDSSFSTIFVSIILSFFLDLDTLSHIKDFGIMEQDKTLLSILLFNELGPKKPIYNRRMAAQMIYEKCLGIKCLSVVNYIGQEKNEKIKSYLRKSLEKIPEGAFYRFYLNADVKMKNKITSSKEMLIKLAKEPNEESRLLALESLGGFCSDDLVDLFLSFVEDKNTLIQTKALSLLAQTKIENPRVMEILASKLFSSHRDTRLAALQGLENLKAKAYVSKILDLLQKDPDLNVKRKAISALTAMKDQNIVIHYLSCFSKEMK